MAKREAYLTRLPELGNAIINSCSLVFAVGDGRYN